jgi:type IV pilus assembly protein PilF
LKNVGSLLLMTLLVALAGCVTTGPGAPGRSGQAELKTASDLTDNQRRAQIRLELAINYYREGQLPVALDELKNALQSDPNLADAYGVRALIYMNMNETSLADENFKTAIRLAPNNPELTSNYGWFLCQNGRAAESIAYFEETLKSRTYQQPSKALNNAGLCSLKLNNNVAAERYFKQAFKFDPTNASATFSLANINYQRRDYEQASFYIGRLLKEDIFSAEVLWLAIRTEHKLGNRTAENSLVIQLRRRFPASNEFAAYQRGAFDE